MVSESSLGGLSVEVLGTIVGYLAVEDICRLRLTSCEIAGQVARTTFKSCFNTKNIKLSHEHLKAVVAITEQAWISSALQRLTIVGLADFSQNKDDSLVSDDREVLSLLTTALTNIRQHSSQGRLCSLSIDVKYRTKPVGFMSSPMNPRELQVYQKCASETARITAGALKTSRLLADELDLYGNTIQFALSPSELALFNDSMNIEACTSLSLAIGADYEDAAAGEISAQFPGQLIRMLEAMKSLEHLHLRWFKVESPSLSKDKQQGHNLLASITEMSPHPSHLKSVSLRGISTTEKSLLSFLATHPDLTSLVLEQVHLLKGSFLPIFAYIDERVVLESLYFNDLWEQRLIQFLSASGTPHFPYSGAPTWMKRSSSHRRRPIRYRQFKGVIRGCAAAANWRNKRQLQYGS